MSLQQKVELLLSKLDAEEQTLLRDLLDVAEQSRAHIELGYGSYSLLKAVQKAYEPEVINLHNWTK